MADKIVYLKGEGGSWFWSTDQPPLEFSDTWIRIHGQSPWTFPSPAWPLLAAAVRLADTFDMADAVEAGKLASYYPLVPADWRREAVARIVRFVGGRILDASKSLPIADLVKKTGLPASGFVSEADLRSKTAGVGRDLTEWSEQMLRDLKTLGMYAIGGLVLWAVVSKGLGGKR